MHSLPTVPHYVLEIFLIKSCVRKKFYDTHDTTRTKISNYQLVQRNFSARSVLSVAYPNTNGISILSRGSII